MFGKRKQPQTKLERRRNARPQRARVVRSSVRPKTDVLRDNKPSKKNTLKLIIALIVVTVLIIWSGFIGNIVVNSSPKNDTANQEVAASADNYFSGLQNFWWFVSTSELEKSIYANSPHVATVEIKRGLLNRKINISVEPRQATFQLKTSNLGYLIAQDGVILQESNDKNASLPVIYDQARVASLKVGRPFLPARDMVMMQSIISELENIKPKSFKHFVLADNTREIQAHLNQDYYIKFSSTEELTDQIRDLKLAQTKLKADPKVYIDVRYSGRVFIK